MKKTKFLLIMMIAFLLIPVVVFADDNAESQDTGTEETSSAEETKNDNKINIYFFRGEGCSHCAEAEEFFTNIEAEYGQYYNIVDYEVWNNSDNNSLMNKVAKYLGQDVSGVPYIIIGKKTWNGYASDYDDDIKAAIKSEYEKDVKSRYDVMDYVNGDKKETKDSSADVVALLIIMVVIGAISAVIIYARKKA